MVRRGMIWGALWLLTACSPSESGKSTKPGSILSSPSSSSERTLRRGNPGEPRTLDPQLADDEFSFPIIRDLVEGLTSESPDGEVVPGVAESWTVDRTGTIYRFRIRPNAKWSDGHRVTAREFVAGMRRAVNPSVASGSAGLLASIKNAAQIIAGKTEASQLGVEAISEEIVQITLEHPAPYILQILSQPVCAPYHVHAAEEYRDSKKSVSKESNGPYSFVTWIPGAYIDLKKNKMYWDREHVQVEKIRYIPETSETTELNQYLAGELEITSTIPMPDFERMRAQHASEMQVSPILGTLFLALNLSEPPLSSNLELRRALSMAIEREQITNQVVRGVSPAFSFVANGIKSYTQQRYSWSKLSRDARITQAKSLYAQAGYSKERPLHIKLFFNSNDGIRRLMVAIAAGWKENLGVETELVSTEFRIFLEERKDHKIWDAIRLGWYADYDDAASFLDIFALSHPQNDARYSNPVFNKLLKSAFSEPDTLIRRNLLERAEKLLLDDYPVIPIYFYNSRRLVKPTVGGASVTPMNRTYSKNLYWK